MCPTESDDCWQKKLPLQHIVNQFLPQFYWHRKVVLFKWLLLGTGSVVLSLIWLRIMRQESLLKGCDVCIKVSAHTLKQLFKNLSIKFEKLKTWLPLSSINQLLISSFQISAFLWARWHFYVQLAWPSKAWPSAATAFTPSCLNATSTPGRGDTMNSPRYFSPLLNWWGEGAWMCVQRRRRRRWGRGAESPGEGSRKSKRTKRHPYLAELLSPLTAECMEGGPQ